MNSDPNPYSNQGELRVHQKIAQMNEDIFKFLRTKWIPFALRRTGLLLGLGLAYGDI